MTVKLNLVVEEIEGVAFLLSDVWHSAVVKHGCVTQEFFGLNSSFQGLKFV